MLLGRGKTGSLVAEVAAERGHKTRVVTETENANGAWLTAENLRDVDAVIDFTTPEAVLANIAACVAARKPMVVGTTGWYGELERVRQEVEQCRHGLRLRRELFLRRESVLPDCPGGRAGAVARILRAHHRAAPHSQEGRAVGNRGGVAACRETGVRMFSWKSLRSAKAMSPEYIPWSCRPAAIGLC